MKNIDECSQKTESFNVIKVINKNSNCFNPVIVNFQNGDVVAGQEGNLSPVFSLDDNGNTKIQVQSVYGGIYKDTINENYGLTNFIAVRNKNTGKMRIVEVDNALLINSALIHRSNTNIDTVDNTTKIRTLNKTFGKKNIVNKLNATEKLNVNSQLLEPEMKQVISDIKDVVKVENVSCNDLQMDSLLMILPPCNRTASTLSEVYTLSEIFTDKELEDLKKEVLNLGLVKKETLGDEYSNYTKWCFMESKKVKDNLVDRLAGVLFIEILIKFIKLPVKKLCGKKTVLCSFSPLITSKILNEFCIRVGSSINRPLNMKDKAMAYLLVVSLICCNFQSNVKELANVTSFTFSRLCRLARIAGAVPAPAPNTGDIYIIKLPLPGMQLVTSKKRK